MTGQPLPHRFGGGRYDQRPPLTRLSFDPAALARPLADLEHVTAAVARRLATFGLETVGDLIEHFPRRYEDFRDRKSIRDLKVGEEATIRGEVVRVSADRTARRRVDIVRVLVRDDTGAVEAVWFNQRYLTRVLQEGMRLSLRGTFRPQGGRQSFAVKGHEILEDESGEGVHTEGVVPVYPASEQVSAKLLRGLVHAVAPAMRRLPDPLPAALLVRERLPGRADAVTAVHLPRTLAEAKLARERLVLEELLLMQVGLLLHKQEQQQLSSAPALPAPGDLSRAFLDGLPFELTAHQLAGAGRARGRPAPRDADAAPAAGRRRLGQDGRRPLLPDQGRGGRAAGRAPGADGDARRAARRDRGSARRRDRAGRARHGVPDGQGAARGAGAYRLRRGAHRHRHARAPAGGRALRRARPPGRGRAAPLRRRAARRPGPPRRSATAAPRTSCT